MKRRTTILLATVIPVLATVATISGSATTSAHAATSWGGGLPQQLYAPYYESYDTSTDMATLSQQSGARDLTLAFLETAQAGSCTAYWNGLTTQPISPATFG